MSRVNKALLIKIFIFTLKLSVRKCVYIIALLFKAFLLYLLNPSILAGALKRKTHYLICILTVLIKKINFKSSKIV